MRRATFLLLLGLSSCSSCTKEDGARAADAGVVREALPRCRASETSVLLPGQEVLIGDVVASENGLLLGVVRRDGQKRVASVMRVSLDLTKVDVVDVGPARGDDPAPSPRWNGATAFYGFHTKPADAGGGTRELRVAKLEGSALVGTVVEQNDESTTFDLAWTEGEASPLVAWDEDAPPREDAGPNRSIDRGFVKVRLLSEGHGKFRIASPEHSDAESPRLLPRKGGYWLAWLARRTEETQGAFDEGPGEKRAFRWVEAVMLDARGEQRGHVRRVSPEKGRAVAFDLATNAAGQLVVIVQDEASPGEGSGGRILRHVLGDGRVDSADIVDGGVGHSIAEITAASDPKAPRWLAWNDVDEHSHLAPLGVELATTGSTPETVLDGARVVASSTDGVYAVVQKAETTELRRFACTRESPK